MLSKQHIQKAKHADKLEEQEKELDAVAEVYFPVNVFSNIMSYCDDRIERNQRIHLAKCMAVLKHLKLLASPSIQGLDVQRTNILDGNFKRPSGYSFHVKDLNFYVPETNPFLELYRKTAILFGLNNGDDGMLGYYYWQNEDHVVEDEYQWYFLKITWRQKFFFTFNQTWAQPEINEFNFDRRIETYTRR